MRPFDPPPQDDPPSRPSRRMRSAQTHPMDVWTEKYRPKLLADLTGNEAVVSRLRHVARRGNMPHLLLAGPPGTGKTTSVLCLAKELLGDAKFASGRFTLELNASDERGIDVVRERIKTFAKELVELEPHQHKIIILDEADSMTQAAQQGLRYVMENLSGSTRFALACNTSTNIIEAIQSRCAIARFTRLTDDEVYRRIEHIGTLEKVNYTKEGLWALVHAVDGDLRAGINTLQATHTGLEIVNKENVLKIADIPPPDELEKMLLLASEGQWRQSRGICHSLIAKGYAPSDLLVATRSSLTKSKIAEHVVLEFLRIVSEAHVQSARGLTTHLQLDKMLASMCQSAIVLNGA